MKAIWVVAVLAVTLTAGARTRESLRIEVVDSTQTLHATRSALPLRSHVADKAILNTILNSEHVKLMCKGDCESLAPGMYTARVHGNNVRIDYSEPVTGKSRHDFYEIQGSW